MIHLIARPFAPESIRWLQILIYFYHTYHSINQWKNLFQVITEPILLIHEKSASSTEQHLRQKEKIQTRVRICIWILMKYIFSIRCYSKLNSLILFLILTMRPLNPGIDKPGDCVFSQLCQDLPSKPFQYGFHHFLRYSDALKKESEIILAREKLKMIKNSYMLHSRL